MIHKKLLSLLVLLMTAVSGAWATDTYTITFIGFDYDEYNTTVTDATLPYAIEFPYTNAATSAVDCSNAISDNAGVEASFSEPDVTINVISDFEGTATVTLECKNSGGRDYQHNIYVTCVKNIPPLQLRIHRSTGRPRQRNHQVLH